MSGGIGVGWKTWRRPTLPRLETQYHGRWGFSRPSSGWDRVQSPRQSHQVVQPTPRAAVCAPRRSVWQVLVLGVCMLCVMPDWAVILVWMTAVQGGDIEPVGRLGPVS